MKEENRPVWFVVGGIALAAIVFPSIVLPTLALVVFVAMMRIAP